MTNRRERNRSLLLFPEFMTNDSPIGILEKLVAAEISEETDIFLVEVRIKPTNNIRIYIDGDKGIGIGRLAGLNRVIYKKIEEEGLYPDGNFSLEVSSPGLDEPLRLYRQYLKNIGRKVEVITQDGGRKEGRLIAVEESSIRLEEEKGKNKKKERIEHVVGFPDIKTTRVQVEF